MLAARHDFIIEQGQHWKRYINWATSAPSNRNLSGASAAMKIRPYPGHSGSEIDALVSGGEITLLDGSGAYNIEIVLADTTTAAYDFLCAWYTLEVTLSSVVYRVLEGNICLSLEVNN